ncbi:MAG: filamentous hemagglutinin N-terminal domain-containing protein, partial [Phycisphaerales bacterium JB043]
MKTVNTPGRPIPRAIALALVVGTTASLLTHESDAAPVVSEIVQGDVSISSIDSSMTIEASNQSIIDWQSFDIASSETVEFIQPNAHSAVLNRVTGDIGPSQIDGTLLANGKVFLVNPAGFVFGPDSVIDAGGFLAAAADLSNDSFNSKKYLLKHVSGEIIAEGLITADAVTLIAQRISNHGTIVANDGLVTLLTAEGVMLKEVGSKIMVEVTNGSTTSQLGFEDFDITEAANKSSSSDSYVRLGAGDAYSLALLNTGTIKAPSGKINIALSNGRLVNEGTISTSVDRGTAGKINLLAQSIVNRGRITADSNNGKAGRVFLSAVCDIILESGSRLSAAGGTHCATGGKLFLFAKGKIDFQRNAVIDISGGKRGGHGGQAVLRACKLILKGCFNTWARKCYKRGKIKL